VKSLEFVKASLAIVIVAAALAVATRFTAFGAEPPAPVFQLKAESPEFWKLMDRESKLTKVAGDFGFTEGPVWDDSGFLYVSDEEKNKIYRVFLDGRKEELVSLGDPDGSTYDHNHRLIDCASVLRAIIALTPDGKYTVLADRFNGKRLNSPNDLVYRSDGALFFTDPPFGLPKFGDDPRREQPHSGVYSVKDGKVQLVSTDFTGAPTASSVGDRISAPCAIGIARFCTPGARSADTSPTSTTGFPPNWTSKCAA